MSNSKTRTTTIETLTAEVHVMMVGSRQITLSVYRQLDRIEPQDITPFGRVRDGHDHGDSVWVVGSDPHATLVRCGVPIEPVYQPPDIGDLIEVSIHYKPYQSTKTLTHGSWRANGTPEAWSEDSVRSHAVVWRDVAPKVLQDPVCDTWRASSVDAAEAIDDLVAAALDNQRELKKYSDAWQALPLIVLAGLR